LPKLRVPPSVFKVFLSTDEEKVLALPSGDMLRAVGTAAIGYAGMIVLKSQGVEVNRGVYVSAS
jgi:hypothetical protein